MEDENYCDISILEKAERDNKIITEYRDKILIQRMNILNEYIKYNNEVEEIYYIYDINSNSEEIYNIYVCDKENNQTMIEENKNNLPEEAKIDTILRKVENNYIVDKVATEELKEKLESIIDELIEEQNTYLEGFRKEGHIYEITEKANDRAWLIDITEGNEEIFEEVNISEEILNKVNDNRKLIYKDGKYEIVK